MPSAINWFMAKLRRTQSQSDLYLQDAKDLDVSRHSHSVATVDMLINSSSTSTLQTDRISASTSTDASSPRWSDPILNVSHLSIEERNSLSIPPSRTQDEQSSSRDDTPDSDSQTRTIRPRPSITIQEPEDCDLPSGLLENSDDQPLVSSETVSPLLYASVNCSSKVHFSSSTMVREFGWCIGDNPSSVRGVALALDWQLLRQHTVPVKEESDSCSDYQQQLENLKIASLDRVRILKEAGYSSKEIQRAIRCLDENRKRRRRTTQNLRWSSFEETQERLWRRLLNITWRWNAKQQEREFLRPYRSKEGSESAKNESNKNIVIGNSKGTTKGDITSSFSSRTAFQASPKDSIRNFELLGDNLRAAWKRRRSSSSKSGSLHLNMAGQVHEVKSD